MKKYFYRELVASLKAIRTEAAKTVVAEIAPPKEIPQDAGRKVWRVRPRKMTSSEIRGMIHEHCGLIKTVDKDMIPGIERRVKRIYEGTSTPTTLERYLEMECDLEPWQAERLVKDQMQKYDARARLESFRKAGVKTVRWVAGDSKEPREWHMHRWPHGLNGYEFDIDNPPIIDPKTGERGYPGQLINCKCRLEAVR